MSFFSILLSTLCWRRSRAVGWNFVNGKIKTKICLIRKYFKYKSVAFSFRLRQLCNEWSLLWLFSTPPQMTECFFHQHWSILINSDYIDIIQHNSVYIVFMSDGFHVFLLTLFSSLHFTGCINRRCWYIFDFQWNSFGQYIHLCW